MDNKLITIEKLERFYEDLRASGINPVLVHSTSEWGNKYKDYVPVKGQLIVYTDYIHDFQEDKYIPSFKMGVGSGEKVGELPFINTPIQDFEEFRRHMNNQRAHVSEADRTYWNNKVSCEYNEEDEELIFVK